MSHVYYGGDCSITVFSTMEKVEVMISTKNGDSVVLLDEESRRVHEVLGREIADKEEKE